MGLLTRTAVIVPTYWANPHLDALLSALGRQGILPSQVLAIDSSSGDDTVERFKAYGARVHTIPENEFDHGGTRAKAAGLCSDSDFLIYLTQDAYPVDGFAFENLLKPFEDPSIGLAYGRQLPRTGAGAIERHARFFNYGAQSEVRDADARQRLGIKSVFCSNSFAAYRSSALRDVGGFPHKAHFAEDQVVAGRMLLKGYRVAYVADACVQHSHNYSIAQDFKRYVDVGIFHGRNTWLLEAFGKAEGEGFRFVRSELIYLIRHEPKALPSALVRTVAKYVGYRIGRMEESLPPSLLRRIALVK